MAKTPLYYYDDVPMDMRKYLRNYGYSFSKRACEYAVSKMRKRNPSSGKAEKIEMHTKEQVEDILKKYNVTLENNINYNFVYVFHMGLADYYKSSIADEQHLALYVKDVIDDIDNNPDNIFAEWITKMDGNGEVVEWDEIL